MSGAPVEHVVVVGARGWIGSAVRAAAQARGLRVTGVDRGTDGGTSRLLAVLSTASSTTGTVVVNAAGRTSGTAAELHESNVELCDAVARVCQLARVPLLSVGSAAEYGPSPVERLAETHPERPASPYGVSKLEATRVLRHRRAEGLTVTVARVFNVVGPGRRGGTDPVQEFTASVRALPPTGGVVRALDASLQRDFASVEWVAGRLVDLTAAVGAHDTVNVCTGTATSFEDLILAMGRLRGVPVRVESTAPGGIQRVVGDPGLLNRLLPAAPLETLEQLAGAAMRPV